MLKERPETQNINTQPTLINDKSLEYNYYEDDIYTEVLNQIRFRTIYVLVSLNLFIFFISGFIAYWFSGKTLKPIKEMTERQKIFIQNAAHDLKTPLTALKMQLELALRNNKFTKKDINNLHNSLLQDVDSINDLINMLINQTKSQNYKSHIKITNVNVDSLIDSILKTLNVHIKEKKIKISKNISETNLKSDKNILRELISIILDNAIKFNKDNGSISISTEVKGNKYIIKIKDTGIGISEKDQKQIFERFYKANKSRTFSGHGLGLSIAKELTTVLDGNISVNSELNKGTTFTITIKNNN